MPEPKIITYKAAGRVVQAFHASNAPVRGLRGPFGCVSGETEFLTRTGWKRIDSYTEGDELLVWDDGETKWEKPLRYISEKSNGLIEFYAMGLVMRLSDDHRVPHYNWNGKFTVLPAAKIAKHPSSRLIPTTFNGCGDGLNMSDDMIRFAVMMHADGHFPKAGNRCYIDLTKERKKARCKEILIRLGVEWRESVPKRSPSSVIFSIPKIYVGKRFEGKWYQCNVHQLHVILDEIRHWDGLYAKPECRYFTTHKCDADFVQYAAHATGRRATIRIVQPRLQHWSPTYVVHIRAGDNLKNRVRVSNVTVINRIPAERQYCFTTSTGYWIARCENTVFVTGNSSKSSACVMELFWRAIAQKPYKGLRRTRWAVVRRTYPRLKETTLKTFCEWLPEIEAQGYSMRINRQPPMVARLTMHLPDKTIVEAEFLFLALDNAQDVGSLQSLDLTGAWLNEAREIDEIFLMTLKSRIPRFPKFFADDPDSGASWSGIIMDTNSPDTDSWWYRMAELEKPQGVEFFDQPPALLQSSKPDSRGHYQYVPNTGQDKRFGPAENVENHKQGYKYWLDMIPGASNEYIDVFILNKYGVTRAGKVVYPEYNDTLHVAKEVMQPYRGIPIIVSIDFGVTPCAIIAQLSPRGQFRVLDELVTGIKNETGQEVRMGIRQFTRDFLKPHLYNKYGGMRHDIVVDPWGGEQRSQVDEVTCIQELAAQGLRAIPALKLGYQKRREAVVGFMQRLIDDEPGFLVNPNCTTVRTAFYKKFVYRRIQSADGEKYSDTPDKTLHPWSDVIDCVENSCSHCEGGTAGEDGGGMASTSRRKVVMLGYGKNL